MRSAAQDNPNRIAGLDGLRALSVIAVVLTHYGLYEGHENAAWLPLVHGITGVRVFFVLSGFLITRLLLIEFARTGRISYPAFIARRALRIFPLYFLFLVLVTLLYAAGWWKAHGTGLAYAWLYAYNFVPAPLYDPLLAHTWSLAVEEHFYLLWPLVLLWFVPRRRALIGVTVLGATACWLSYIVLLRTPELRAAFPERMSFVAAFSLLVGCGAAVLAQNRQEGLVPRLCRRNLALVLAAVLFAAPTLLQLAPELAQRVLPRYLAVSLQSVAVAIFVLWIVAHQRGRLVVALEAQPLRYVGTISYGIYVWQGFFLAVSPARAADSAWPPSPELGLLGIVLLAPLSYHFFERRFLAMKARFTVVPSARE